MLLGDQSHPAPFPPPEITVTHFIGDWIGPRTGLVVGGKSRANGIRTLERPVRRKSIYTESGPVFT